MPDFGRITSPRFLSGQCGLLFAAALALLQIGCSGGEAGPDLYATTGTVTYNGEPVPNASVTFQPEKGPIATGTTDAQGKFALKTGANDGAVAGPHKVAITAVAGSMVMANPTPADMAKMAADPKPAEPPKSLIPEKYNTHDKSGLTAEVTSDATKNNFPFELKD